MSLGKKPNNLGGSKNTTEGDGRDINEAGFGERAKQHQMEFNNKRPKSTIQNKTKVTLFLPERGYLRRCP
jgi:hypothetical protein